jgi:predicted small integral membrane protein
MTLTLRLTQGLFAAYIGAFGLLVAFGNLTDYGTNFAFVQHVMSMDTIFPGNGLRYRAITNPQLHHLAYWVIILGEALSGVLCSVGALRLLPCLHSDTATVHSAKSEHGKNNRAACLLSVMPDLIRHPSRRCTMDPASSAG